MLQSESNTSVFSKQEVRPLLLSTADGEIIFLVENRTSNREREKKIKSVEYICM